MTNQNSGIFQQTLQLKSLNSAKPSKDIILCQISLNEAERVLEQISVKQITGKAKRTCFQNLKLLLRNVAKPKDGCVCCSIRTRLMKKSIKTTEIFAVALGDC